MNEGELYKPVWENLKKLFIDTFGGCHLEITYDGKFSEDLKSNFDDIILFFLKEHSYPDITGFVKNPEGDLWFIVVEIKDKKVGIRDFYQAKMYAEVFKAHYCFLVSTQPLSEEIKRVFKSKKWINRYTKLVKIKLKSEIISIPEEFHVPENVFFAQYDKEKKRVLEYSWFPRHPFHDYFKYWKKKR